MVVPVTHMVGRAVLVPGPTHGGAFCAGAWPTALGGLALVVRGPSP